MQIKKLKNLIPVLSWDLFSVFNGSVSFDTDPDPGKLYGSGSTTLVVWSVRRGRAG